MSKKEKIKITFKIYKQDGETELDCDRNQPISKYRNKLGDIPNNDKLVFATEDDAYIDDDTLCKNIENQYVCLRMNGALKINVNISNDEKKEPIKQFVLRLKLSSTVKDFKAKLEPTLKELELDHNIQIKCGDEELSEEDHIFSYKKKGDLEIDVIVLNDINEKTETYYFKFPNNEVRGFELNPDTTFSKINKMEEFSEQDYSFFIKDSEINKRSKISEYDGAKEKSAPIQLRINYFILVALEGSNNDPKDYHHPFASDQTIGEVLDEYAQVVNDRRKLEYSNQKYNEETKLSEIDYKKDQPLTITIFPAEYSFVIEDEDNVKEEFKLRLNADLTIKKLIRKIQKEKGINHDLEIYTGTRMDPVKREETDTVSEFTESEKIIIKKVEPQYEITFNGRISRKGFDVNCTVTDLLNSSKRYKSPNERQKTIAKHKEEILADDKLLCELYPRKIAIEFLDPVYQFKLEGKDPIKISIPDDSDYDEAITIVKEKIKEIEEIENERIEFQLKDFTFDYETKFGPDISQENPIVIKILDPDYNWVVKETEDDDGKDEDFSFPTEFTIGDAIKEIEKKFENKCSIKILQKSKNRITQIKDDVNIYENYYNNAKVHVYVQKCPITFSFATKDKEFKKEFNNDDKVIHIAKYLRLKDKKLSFSESSSDDAELSDRLEFEYKGNKYNSTSTFDSLNYQPYEEDKIQINLLPPNYYVYSLSDSQKYQVKDKMKLSDIEIPKEDKEQCIIYQNFKELLPKDKISFETYSIIDYFTYQKKIDFKFGKKEFSIYINNDENITIEEIKALVSPHLIEIEATDKIYGPERICLTLKNEIKDGLFKDVEYKEGDSIKVSINKKQFNVKANDAKFIVELDDEHQTLSDLQKEIKGKTKKKGFVLKYRKRELKSDKDLINLHLPKNDYINVEFKKSKTLSYNDNEYKLDGLDLKNTEELKKHFQNVFEIDVDNSKFMCDKHEIKLKDFGELGDGACVKVKPKGGEKMKFKGFEDDVLNGKFDTDQTIGDVRNHLIKDDPDKKPVLILSDTKLLSNSVKLFQVENKITYKILEGNSCQKKLKFKDKLIEDIFDFDIYGKDLKYYVNCLAGYKFKLVYDGKMIGDDDRICEIGEEIIVDPLNGTGKSIKFHFSDENNNEIEMFYKDDNLESYKKELKHDDYDTFFENGKLLSSNKLIEFSDDENTPIIYAYQSVKNDNELYSTAKCVERIEKPKLEITEIVVDSVANAEKDDPTEGQIKIKYDPDIKTVFDLRKIIANKNGFTKEEDMDSVSLFIPFSVKEATDFALLRDDEQIIDVLTENNRYNIAYMIISAATTSMRPNTLKRYRKVADDCGIKIDDDEIKEIFKRTGGKVNMILASIEYRASKVELVKSE